jgi:molybdate transport system substrate-binding protein
MKPYLLILLSFACLFVGCSGEELVIFGAMSLTDALTEISQRFGAVRNLKVYCNFAGSSTLQRQIEKGAPADVFISASPKQIDALQQKGLIYEDSRRAILNNRLVLVAPVNSSLSMTDVGLLAQDSVRRIAIGEPNSVPAGIYGKEALTHLGVWDTVQSKLVPGADVRSTLAYVESGEVDVGIVYQTDAGLSKKVKSIYQFPNSSHSPIVYPAAVLRNTAHKALAQAFLDYLQTAEVAAIFEKYGFSVVK